ncbi:hypothetical protein OC845_004024 [Tilletia horrida]|nr:hypothetical protein OC845_004024 [Tilletia horrida]
MPPRRTNLRGRANPAALPSRAGLSTRSSIGSATATPTSNRISGLNTRRTTTAASSSTAQSDSSGSAAGATPASKSATPAAPVTAASTATKPPAATSAATSDAADASDAPEISASARIAAGAAAIANAAASAAARRDAPASPASASASTSVRGSPFQNAVLGRSGGGSGSELTTMQQRTKETIERILEYKIESMIPRLQSRIQRGITPALMQKVTDSVTERFEQFAQEYARVKSSLTRASATPAPTAPRAGATAPPAATTDQSRAVQPVGSGPSTAVVASTDEVEPLNLEAAAADEDHAAVEELIGTDKTVEPVAPTASASSSGAAQVAPITAPISSQTTAVATVTPTPAAAAPAQGSASSSVLASLPPLPDKNATDAARIEALEKRDLSLVHALKTLDAQLRGVSSQVEHLVRWKKLIEQHALRAETAAAAAGAPIGAGALNKRPGSLLPAAPSPLQQQQAISRHHLMQQQMAQGAIVGRASFPPGPSSSTPFRKRKRKPVGPAQGDESIASSAVGGDTAGDISTVSNESPNKRQRTDQDGDSANDTNAANRANQPDRDLQIAFLDLLRAEMGLTDRKWPAFPGYDVSELDWPRFDPTEAQLAAWQALPPSRRPPIGTIGTRKLRLDWDLTPTNPTIQNILVRLRDQILANPDEFNVPNDPVRRDAEVALNAIKRSYFEVRRHGKQANATARANGSLKSSGQQAASAAAAAAQALGSTNPAIASTGTPTAAAIDPPKVRGRPRKDRDSLIAGPSATPPAPPAVSAPPAKGKRGPKPGFKKAKAAAEAAAAAAAGGGGGGGGGASSSSAVQATTAADSSAAATSTGARTGKELDKEKSRTVYNIKQRRVARRKARRQQRENELKKRNGWTGTDIETATSLDAVSEDETDAESEQQLAAAEDDEDGKKKKTMNAPARAIVPEWRSKELALVIADLEKTIKRSRSILPPLGLTPIRTALPSTLRRWQVSETFAKAHPDLVQEVQLNMGPFMGSPSNGSPTVAKSATSWGTPLVLNFSGAGAPTIVMGASGSRGSGGGASGSGQKSSGGGSGSRSGRAAGSSTASGGNGTGSGGSAAGGSSSSAPSGSAGNGAAAAESSAAATSQAGSAGSGSTGYSAARAGSAWAAMPSDGFGGATSTYSGGEADTGRATTEMPSRSSSVADTVSAYQGHQQQHNTGYSSTQQQQQQQSTDSGVGWYPTSTTSGSAVASAAHAQYSGHSSSSRQGGYLSLTASPQTRGASASGTPIDEYGSGGTGSGHLRNSSIRGTSGANAGSAGQASSTTDYSSHRGSTAYPISGYMNGGSSAAARNNVSTAQTAPNQQQAQQQQTASSYWPFGYNTTTAQQHQQQHQQHSASGSNNSNLRSTFGWGFSSNG